MKVNFAPSFITDTLDFQNGEYSRKFERKDQPFEVTDEEWATLARTGHFVAAKGKKAQGSQQPAEQK